MYFVETMRPSFVGGRYGGGVPGGSEQFPLIHIFRFFTTSFTFIPRHFILTIHDKNAYEKTKS